jgi:hypothetical protein
MKKAIIGAVAIGAVFGLAQVGRRMSQRMREHCEQMVGQFAGRSEAVSTTRPHAHA